MKPLVPEVLLLRLVLPLIGICFVLWGVLPPFLGVELPGGADTTRGMVTAVIIGAVAFLVSIIYWRLPPEER